VKDLGGFSLAGQFDPSNLKSRGYPPACIGCATAAFGGIDLSIQLRTFPFNQTPRVQKLRFAQPLPDKLQAGHGNMLIIHRDRNR